MSCRKSFGRFGGYRYDISVVSLGLDREYVVKKVSRVKKRMQIGLQIDYYTIYLNYFGISL